MSVSCNSMNFPDTTIICKLFNVNDYKSLNKDLNFKTLDEYKIHFMNQGRYEFRLCNKKQLDVINEFSIELTVYISYYYYLFKKELLFDNVITTYNFMKPYYFWIPDNQIKYKNEKRQFTDAKNRNLPINSSEHVTDFDYRFYIPIPLKEYYQNFGKIINFQDETKETLIISNKYNQEWGDNPINFIDKNTLQVLFEKLSQKYNIIYFCVIKNMNNYSYDNNNICIFDHDLLFDKYHNVIYFDEYIKKNKLDYNLVKCITLAHCENYIGVQGGNSHLISFFYKKFVILHKKGGELTKNVNSYNGWYKKMGNIPENEKQIVVAQDQNNFLKCCIDLYQ